MRMLFLMLITAHLIGDFVLQSDGLAAKKKNGNIKLLYHSAIITLTAIIIIAALNPILYILVFLQHLIIDKLKLSSAANLKGFAIDQAVHIISLLVISVFLTDNTSSYTARLVPYYEQILITASGFILCVFTGGVIVSKLTHSLTKELSKPKNSGLINGGKLIGKLERAMAFILVIFGQPAAIGFIFAAKSILRFGEIKDASQRKEAEYIIIGTFASFGWAMLTAFITAKLLQNI